MIDAVNDRIAPMVPFMTGAFKDAALAKDPLFTVEKALAEYAAANAAKTPAKEPSTSQDPGSKPVAGQNIATPAAATPATPATPAIPGVSAATPATPAEPAFQPAFRKATGTDGSISWSLNSTYFATKETAEWIANKFGTGEIVEVPFGGNGGLFTSDANEFHAKLKDGSLVNAGILAGYYQRNPPDKFPGLAEKLIRAQLGLVS